MTWRYTKESHKSADTQHERDGPEGAECSSIVVGRCDDSSC
jgi:hypothetical protein